MQRVLITGGAGYLGSVLTEHLLKRGEKVTCLDNLMYGQKSPVNFVSDSNFEFVYGDARNEDLLRKLVPKADTIVPLAAIVGMPACDRKPKDAVEINKDAITSLNRIRGEGQRVIYPNTNSGYGAQSGESYCTEETPLEPISLYGTTKCAAERELLDGEKDALTLRLATVFGISPRMRTDLMVNDFVLKAMQDRYLVIFQGDFKRNFIHIKDVADTFIHCMDNYGKMKNEPYNAGLDSANMSKLELAQKVQSHIPALEIISKEIDKDPDKRDYIVSSDKLHNSGFRPSRGLDEGITELMKAYEILLIGNPYKNI